MKSSRGLILGNLQSMSTLRLFKNSMMPIDAPLLLLRKMKMAVETEAGETRKVSKIQNTVEHRPRAFSRLYLRSSSPKDRAERSGSGQRPVMCERSPYKYSRPKAKAHVRSGRRGLPLCPRVVGCVCCGLSVVVGRGSWIGVWALLLVFVIGGVVLELGGEAHVPPHQPPP